ncbi:unnamed protein product [Didymodactylos carnosus]|uniref:Protein fem-1 homolog B n=1 Tax=Didymodactylos carnosus TaxID=1234261 RepID=A0A8S2PRB5_9BILA|nr:unnamed protein product [Didymodactylos carnosus]CAF4067067.1 unnamed protein product [Didymodactylos carnosus]
MSLSYENDRYQYMGEYRNGKRHGEGRCRYSESPCLEWEGQWLDDKWHMGILTWQSRSNPCIGRWNGGKTLGVFTSQCGDVYKGEWKEGGIAHGCGFVQYADGMSYKGNGMWRNGSRHGHGKMTYRDSKQEFNTEWSYGRMLEPKVDVFDIIKTLEAFSKEIDDTHQYKPIKKLINFTYSIIRSEAKRTGNPDRLLIVLETILANIRPEYINLFINDLIQDRKSKCNILILAANNGFYKIVEAILKRFNVNVELEGFIKYENQIIDGVTALWCAALCGNLPIVQTLVEHGANINHWTKLHSTPLRAACFFNSFDVAKYLIDHGADVNIQHTSMSDTCLMLASYKGYLEICKYLLEKGCKVNMTDNDGSTALHCATEQDHLVVVQCLIDNGADISIKNRWGFTPLMLAALTPNEDIANYLINKTADLQESIEGLELLATSYANDDVSIFNFEKVYSYLLKAMQLRYADHTQLINKNIQLPIEAYQNHCECQTIEELQRIRHNHDALHMETLVIRERLLGTESSKVIYSISTMGAVYADEKKFDRCLSLWLRVLYLRKISVSSMKHDLLTFAKTFGVMIDLQVNINTDVWIQVFQNTIEELHRNRLSLKASTENTSQQQLEKQNFDDNCYTLLYLILVISKVVRLGLKRIQIC